MIHLRSHYAEHLAEIRDLAGKHVASLEGLQGKFYPDAWVFLHATAEQKIKALAAVLRPLVEQKERP